MDLPDAGERVAINMDLTYTTLTVPTLVPANDVCSGSGYSWKYKFNIANGISVGAAVQSTVAIMGVSIVQISVTLPTDTGTGTGTGTGTDLETHLPPRTILVGGEVTTNSNGSVGIENNDLPSGSTSLRRTSWRELTP